jgi:hypothetical protein
MNAFDFSQGPYSGMSTPRNEFPALLTYADASERMWSLPEHEIFLGVDGEGAAITWDMGADSPHALISAGSGAGKSVTARSIATQALAKGATVVILDAKRHSHRWAKNLPGVHYACTMPEIGNALVSVAAELHRRNEVVEQWPGDVETAPVGPRIVLIFEEMNATMDSLADLDKQQSRGAYTCAQAHKDILFLGRAAKINEVAISQYAADRGVLSPALRENFGVRILIAHTWETWNALVPRAGRAGGAPAAPTAKGRGYVVVKGKATETQLLLIDEEMAAHLVRGRESQQERPRVSRRQDRRRARRATAATARATGRTL